MGDAEREHPAEALGRLQRGEEPVRPAPVMPDPLYLRCVEGIEERDQVAGQPLLFIAGSGRLRPPMPSEIGCDDSEALHKPRDDLTPHPPVLGPTLHQHHSRCIVRSGHCDVDPRTRNIHVFIPNAGKLERIQYPARLPARGPLGTVLRACRLDSDSAVGARAPRATARAGPRRRTSSVSRSPSLQRGPDGQRLPEMGGKGPGTDTLNGLFLPSLRRFEIRHPNGYPVILGGDVLYTTTNITASGSTSDLSEATITPP